MGAGEFLGDGVFDSDAFDSFIKAAERVVPDIC
jgi:hypothetical protein